MKRLIVFSVFLILLLGTMLYAQVDVSIGAGTTYNAYSSVPSPYGTYFKNFRQQYLYTAAELENAGGGAGNIYSLAFNVQNPNTCSPMPGFTIRIKETSQTVLTTTFETGTYTTVFSQDNFQPTAGWNTHTFSTPFYWNGSSNLLVDVFTTFITGSYTQNASVYYSTTSAAMALRYQSDSVDAETATTGTTSTTRSNIRFNMTAFQATNPPNATTLVAPVNNATYIPTSGITLSWNMVSGGPDGYKLYFGTNPTPPFEANLGNVLSHNTGVLQAGTQYYWQIVPYNTHGDATNCPVWSFTTTPAGLVTIGTGNSNQYLPVYPYYGYTYSQSIYLQSEINVPDQRIEKLYYYWNGAAAAPNSKDWVIYMGHTDKEVFASDSDWLPLIELTQVFDGMVNLTNTPGWIEIVLHTPFVYNNSENLVIAVDENTPQYDGGQQFFFNTLSPGQNRSLRFYNDAPNPDPASPPIGTLVAAYPNISLQFSGLPSSAVLTCFPTSLDFGLVRHQIASAPQSIRIANNGGGSLNLVDVAFSFIGEHPTEFSIDISELPDALEPGHSAYISVRAIATTAGPISASLRISYNGINHDVALSAIGLPAGMVRIGDGDSNQMLPVHANYGYTYSQSIFLQSEIAMPNQSIEKLYYYWNGAAAAPNSKDWVIYMGHTNKEVFVSNSDWLPLSELIQVFDGMVNLTNTPGWVEIVLQIPFVYNNSQNLVIAVDENTPQYDGNTQFFFSTLSPGQNRSLRYYNDSTNLDPATPPNGTLVAAYPNISLQFSELPSSSVLTCFPTSLDFGEVMHEIATAPKRIRIANTGGGSLNLVDVAFSFVGEHPTDFSFDISELPDALGPGHSAYLSVTAIATTVGPISASLRISYNGINNDVALCAIGLPAGMVRIGDGDSNQRLPVYPYYGYTYSQSIFLQSEIEMPNQRIKKLYYYWNGAAAAPNSKDWVIYMGHTNKEVFVSNSDWLPLSELTQVFYGMVNLTNTPGWVEIVLHTPFVYNNSQNLVIAVDENTPQYDGSAQFFFSTLSPGQNRSLRFYNDDPNPDPASPPNGTLVDAYPNIMLTFAEIDLHNIAFPVLQVNMQEPIPSLNLHEYFSSEYPMQFSCFSEEPINCEINANGILSINAPTNWHGVSYIRIRAAIIPEIYVEQMLILIIIESELFSEGFDHAGALPVGWTQNNGGTSTIPWQPLAIAGANYALYTSASIGKTANERLLSPAYNLSTLKDIVVSFDSDFLPYTNTTGSFAYSLNNVTYSTVESYSTAHDGRKTYQIPALDGKTSVRFRWTYANSSVNGGAENHWKLDNFSISGVVKDITVPTPVTNLLINEYHPDYVELSWQPGTDHYFARYEIYISEDEVVDTNDLLWSVEQDANLTFETTNSTRISGLEPAMYWVALRAVDLSGNASAMSNIVQFYANDGTGPVFSNPIPALQPLPEWQETGEAIIGCTISDNNLIDPATIMYRVDLNANGSYDIDETWHPALLRASRQSRSGFQSEYEIEVALQFASDGIYAFEFKAQDVYGNTSYSGMQNAEGIADDWVLRIDSFAPAEMDFFFVQELADNSVTLAWDASYDLNFKGYRILYGTAVDALSMIWDWEDDSTLAIAGTGVIFTTISGLQSGTRYWFQLSAWDLAGSSTVYPELISAITSSDAAPKAPENLRLEVQGSILQLSWDAVTEDIDGNPIVVNAYHIYFGETPDFDCDFDSYFYSTPDCSVEMEDLVEYVDRMFFKVIAEAGAIRKRM